MEVQGAEEHRLLGALTATERRHLSDLLRRVLLVAEQAQSAPRPTERAGNRVAARVPLMEG